MIMKVQIGIKFLAKCIIAFIESIIVMTNLSPNNEVTNRYLLDFYMGNTANHLTLQGQVSMSH